jgi:HEAT repeat protein
MSGRLLTRYGLSFGLLMLPIANALSTGSAALSGLLFGIAGVFLWLVVVTKLFDEVFRNSVQAHAFRILYQPLPVGQRLRVQTIRESIVEPMAIGLSGVLLLLCTSVASLSALHLLYIVLGLLAACVALSIVLRHEYTRVLLHALTKKRLRGLHVTLEDHSSLEIVQRGLESPNASEVIHCLQILEENEHPSLVSSLLQVIEHPEPKVRHYVLDRIGSLQLSPATDLVRQRVASETSAVVRGHALRTLCAIGDDAEIFERMPLYLDHPDHEIKQGALVGLLRSGGIDGVLTAGAHVNNLLASPEAAERKLAAQVLGDVGIFHFYHPLLRLLRDSDLQVRKAALEAAGRVRNVKLVPLLLADLSDITVREEAFSALMQFGAEVIPALEVAFLRKEQSPETRICIARLCGRIGGAEAIAFLRQHLRFPDASVRHHILSALALCKYHAPPDERPSVEDAIRHEVEDATWAFATLDDLGAVAEFAPLTQALLQAVKKHRERTLLLLAFIYPAEPVLQAKANLESDVSEKRASALEALDNLIAQHLKNLLFPLLDDITPEERLARFKAIFPQPQLSHVERLQDIVLHAHARATAWTRTCALFAMGKARLAACCESMVAAVADPDPVVRETAAWALCETDRTAYQQQVDILLVDPSPLVRRTLARLNVSRQEAGPASS